MSLTIQDQFKTTTTQTVAVVQPRSDSPLAGRVAMNASPDLDVDQFFNPAYFAGNQQQKSGSSTLGKRKVISPEDYAKPSDFFPSKDKAIGPALVQPKPAGKIELTEIEQFAFFGIDPTIKASPLPESGKDPLIDGIQMSEFDSIDGKPSVAQSQPELREIERFALFGTSSKIEIENPIQAKGQLKAVPKQPEFAVPASRPPKQTAQTNPGTASASAAPTPAAQEEPVGMTQKQFDELFAKALTANLQALANKGEMPYQSPQCVVQ